MAWLWQFGIETEDHSIIFFNAIEVMSHWTSMQGLCVYCICKIWCIYKAHMSQCTLTEVQWDSGSNMAHISDKIIISTYRGAQYMFSCLELYQLLTNDLYPLESFLDYWHFLRSAFQLGPLLGVNTGNLSHDFIQMFFASSWPWPDPLINEHSILTAHAEGDHHPLPPIQPPMLAQNLYIFKWIAPTSKKVRWQS